MTQIQMTKTMGFWVSVLNIGAFVFWICFEFRISKFEFACRPQACTGIDTPKHPA
jgi:hypothetical protein